MSPGQGPGTKSRIRVVAATLCAVFIPDVRSAQTSTHIFLSQEHNGPLIEKNAQGSGMGFLSLTLMAMRFFWIFAMVFFPFLHVLSMMGMGHTFHLCTQP